MARLANGTRHGQAGNGPRLASGRDSCWSWSWKSRGRIGRPCVPRDVRASDSDHVGGQPAVGGPRIHGELLKLGVDVSQASVAKYMVRRHRPPSQTWRTFLTNHLHQIAAADFFVVPTATCRSLFVLVILAHERRRIVHVAVTDHPTGPWAAQQLREAFPLDEAPRYLVHDRDTAFHAWATATPALGIEDIVTAVRSPWQNAYAERLIGSIRRECLDHIIISNERGLRRVLRGTWSITCDSEHTSRSTKTRRSRDRWRQRPTAAPSWRFRSSVACTTATNVARLSDRGVGPIGFASPARRR